MAVSYISKPVQSSPYVLPIDLNLFQNVLSVKQKQFDIQHDKMQSEIDQMGLLDVIKPEDKNYLTSKIQNLVSSINSFGGVDFSDPATSSQIEGLGADVYGDDKILNAVSSTKSIRSLIKTYQDYKTNPKLSKLYSPVNEWYDMRAVNDYMNDGQTGSSYHGPSTASPYVPYKDNLMKALDKIKLDKQVELKDNGLYWSKTEQSFITPQRIYQMASDLLTPDESMQLGKDGIYQYSVVSPLPPDELIRRGLNEYYNKIEDQKSLVKQYRDAADAAIGDPKLREQWTKLGDQAEGQLKTLQTNQQTAVKQSIDAYKSNPDGYKSMVYKEDFLRGLSNRYSVNQIDVSIIDNKAEMFKQRMEQAERFHSDDVNYKKQLLDIQREKNAIDMFGKVYKSVDPKTGQTTYHPLPYDQQGLQSFLPNIEDPNKLKVDQNTLTATKTQLKQEADQGLQQWLGELGSLFPNLGFDKVTETQQSNQSETGVVNHLRGLESIENYNGQPGIQMEDLRAIYRFPERLKNAGWTDQQVQFLKDVYGYYHSIVDGKGSSTPNLPPGAVQAITQYALKQERIDAIDFKVNSVNQELYKQAGLTPQEIKDLETYVSDPNRADYGGFRGFLNQASYTLVGTDRKQKLDEAAKAGAVFDKIKKNTGKDFRSLQSDYFSKIPTRDVFGGRVFSPDDDMNGQISNFLQIELTNSKGEPYGKSDKVKPEDVSKITPIMTGRMSDGTGRYYILASIDKKESGGGTTKQTYMFPIEEKNANQLGLFKDPYEDLNYTVNIKGRSGDLPAYGNKNLAVSVNVVKTPANSLNGANYVAQAKYYYLDANGQRIGKYELLPIPGTEAPTASVAYQQALTLVQQAAKNPTKPVKYDEFKQWLQDSLANQNQ